VLFCIAGAASGAEDAIVLGAALPLTGSNAQGGAHVRDGYVFAVRKINQTGGVKVGDKTYRLELRYYDDESAPGRALALVHRLIEQEGVGFMLGPYGADPVGAILPVVETHKVPLIEASGDKPDVFSKGYRYHFGLLSTADQCLVPVIRYAAKHAAKLGKTQKSLRVALAVTNEPFAQNVRAGALEEIRRQGMMIVIDDQLADDTADLSATLRRVEMLRPDVLLISGKEEGALTGVRQVRSMKIEVPILAATHCDSAKLAETLKEAAENVFCTFQWHRALEFKDPLFGEAEAFAQEFAQTYDYEASHQAAASAAAVYVFADAFKRARSLERKAVRDAIAETNLQTFYGPIKFGVSGRNVAKTMVLTRIQGGKYVVVPSGEWVNATPLPSTRD